MNYTLSFAQNSSDFNTTWDFNVQAGSPVLGKGKTDFTPHYKAGLTLGGNLYSSPSAASFIGSKGTK